MNRERRKELDRAAGLLDEARAIFDAVKGDEEAAFDNLPESLQEGERGQRMQEAVDSLDEAANAIDDIIEHINAAKGET